MLVKTMQSLFSLWNYAQITNRQFHLLFVHNDNKSNSGQIGQVIAMGGSGKTKDFFLWHKSSWVMSSTKSSPSLGFEEFTLDTFVFNIFECCKIIICFFILHKIRIVIFKFCKSFRCFKNSITFLVSFSLAMYLKKVKLFYKVHYIFNEAVIFPCIASKFMQLGSTYLSS